MTRPQMSWVVLAAALALGTDVAAQQLSRETLVARAGWARLVVIEGRLTALPLANHRNRSTSLTDPDSGVTEMLSVDAAQGRATLHFQRTDPVQQLTVDFVRGDTVSIHREPRGDSRVPSLHFTQGEGLLSLSVGDGPDRRFAAAPDLWRLLIVHRELCTTHLTPVLESLRSDWALLDTAERSRSAMVRAIEFDLPAKRERCLALVQQLASPLFRERRAAYTQLQHMGRMALACLGDLDRYDLDAEQRRRLQALSGEVQQRHGDTPDLIAARLIGDASMWLELLADEQPRVRRIALEQIEALSGRDVEFDVEADADIRRHQLEQLRKRLGRG